MRPVVLVCKPLAAFKGGGAAAAVNVRVVGRAILCLVAEPVVVGVGLESRRDVEQTLILCGECFPGSPGDRSELKNAIAFPAGATDAQAAFPTKNPIWSPA